MDKKEIIKKIKKYIRTLKRHNIKIKKAFLFGSAATGKHFSSDSDLDVAIISNQFGKNVLKESALLFEKTWDVDTRIEPFPIPLNEFFDKDNPSPIIEEIKKTGIEIPV